MTGLEYKVYMQQEKTYETVNETSLTYNVEVNKIIFKMPCTFLNSFVITQKPSKIKK